MFFGETSSGSQKEMLGIIQRTSISCFGMRAVISSLIWANVSLVELRIIEQLSREISELSEISPSH